MSEEFMLKMVRTYSTVHNSKYWDEITPYIEKLGSGKILDIGCGPGMLLRDVSSKYNSKKIYALDQSEIMLIKCKEVMREAFDQDRLILLNEKLLVDGTTLPNGLSLIFSSKVMRNFTDQIEIMMQIRKSLIKGGIFVLLDWSTGSLIEYQEYFKKNSNEFNTTPEYIIKMHRNFSRYSVSDWKYILKTVGFEVVHSFSVTDRHNCIIAQNNESF